MYSDAIHFLFIKNGDETTIFQYPVNFRLRIILFKAQNLLEFILCRKRSDLTPPELRPIELEGDGGRASPNTSQKRQVNSIKIYSLSIFEKKKCPLLFKVLITNLREWFANTPIHGARYFMSRKLHWSER